jgi:WD40 repeat protein
MILLQGARERVEFLQFSPDGRSLVAPCSRGVQVWHDLTSGSRPATTFGHPYIRLVRFTPDGLKLLLDASPAWVAVYDLAARQAVQVPLELAGGGGSCDLTPDGQSVVVTRTHTGMDPPGRLSCRPTRNPEATLWSVAASRWLYSRPLFLAGGERFVVFEGRPDVIPFWYVTRDARTGHVVTEVGGSGQQFTNPVMSADRNLVAARRGSWLGVFRADDFAAKPIVIRNDNRKEFTGLAFHPSGRFLAATSNDARVKLYDTATWKLTQAFDWDIGRLRSVVFSNDGMLAAAGSDKGRIVVWDVDL